MGQGAPHPHALSSPALPQRAVLRTKAPGLAGGAEQPATSPPPRSLLQQKNELCIALAQSPDELLCHTPARSQKAAALQEGCASQGKPSCSRPCSPKTSSLLLSAWADSALHVGEEGATSQGKLEANPRPRFIKEDWLQLEGPVY